MINQQILEVKVKTIRPIQLNTDGTASVPLTQGKTALIDSQDVEKIQNHNWCFHHQGYAITFVKKGKFVSMHRLLVDPDALQEVDHINGNGLDNRRSNLRLVTKSQNQQNKKKSTGCSSRFKGVSWNKRSKKWVVDIRIPNPNKTKGTLKRFGYFNDEIQAAKVYNAVAKQYFGEHAKLNEV